MVTVGVAPAPRVVPRDVRASIAARVEVFGLVLGTAVAITAAALAITGKTVRSGDLDGDLRSGRVVALHAAPHADAIAAVMVKVWPLEESAAIAAELATWLTTHRPQNVGALAQIAVPASRVRDDPRLDSLRVRLAAAEQRGEVNSVPLVTSSELAALKPSFLVRTTREFGRAAWLSLVLLVLPFYGLHVVRRIVRSPSDPLLLPAVHLLCGVGFAVMIGLRDPLRDFMIFQPFAAGVAVGCAIAALAWRLPIERLALQYAPLLTAFAISGLLIAFGSGPAGSDAKVNLWGVQPVESIRLLVVLYLAAYFGRRWQYLRDLRIGGIGQRPRLRWFALPPLEYVVPVAVALALVAMFFVAQRDLGPALVFGCTFLALWAVAVRRPGLAVAGVASLAAGFWLVARIGFPAMLATRVAMARDPWNNAVPGGDQVANALWALATGGVAGTGPGLGEPQYLPAGYTDLVLAVVGEEMGLMGLLAVALVYAVILHRALTVARRAASDFNFFLALALTFATFIQLVLISGGVIGILPLSGVVTPFLSYGRSAMAANFCAVGLLLAISESGTPSPRPQWSTHFRKPVAWVTASLALLAVAFVARAAQVQVWAADETMSRPALVQLADGGLRFMDNPRLLAAARQLLGRGPIVDRNGIPLATSDPRQASAHAAAYASMGIDLAHVCPPDVSRCYPLGGATYHLLGDVSTERDWIASNTSFIERDASARLLGYDDFERTVEVQPPGGGPPLRIARRDLRQLIPLVRYRYRPDYPDVRTVRERSRVVRLALDARLQARAAAILSRGVRAIGSSHGAAAVVDPLTGDVLAAVSYPWPVMRQSDSGALLTDRDVRLDRVRYGLYPPGSTFKLVTAAATLAIRPELASARHMCTWLPDGRVGIRMPGVFRPIRDDALDRTPHGQIGLDEALRVSCNAYFAQQAVRIGAAALHEMASRFGIAVAQPNTPARLRGQLAYVGFGQGETVVSPMRLLGVTSAIAAGGTLVDSRWVLEPATPESVRVVLPEAGANRIARAMGSVVAAGTGRLLRKIQPPIAGKTGTAEAGTGRSHAWFTGFAPYNAPGRRLAFIVLVEHGGYGARAAAPIAGQIVEAARELRLFEEGHAR